MKYSHSVSVLTFLLLSNLSPSNVRIHNENGINGIQTFVLCRGIGDHLPLEVLSNICFCQSDQAPFDHSRAGS